MTALQLATSSEKKLRNLAKIQNLLRATTSPIQSLSNNSVKLFVIIGSLLEGIEPGALTPDDIEFDHDSNEGEIRVDQSVLSLIASSLPLLSTDSSLLFALITPSLFSVYQGELTEGVEECIVEFVRMYGVGGVVCDDVVGVGLEHDNPSVRKSSLRLIPTLLSQLPRDSNPDNDEIYRKLIEATIGRVRDVEVSERLTKND